MKKSKTMDLSASLEDYLEAIFNIGRGCEDVHSKEIAEMLGVAKSSVTGALRMLKKKELVHYKPYGCVTLTDAGRSVAAEIVHKHNILSAFFIDVLGVDESTAQRAACRAEHALGTEIIERLLCFIEFVTKTANEGQGVVERFEDFRRDRTPTI